MLFKRTKTHPARNIEIWQSRKPEIKKKINLECERDRKEADTMKYSDTKTHPKASRYLL